MFVFAANAPTRHHRQPCLPRPRVAFNGIRPPNPPSRPCKQPVLAVAIASTPALGRPALKQYISTLACCITSRAKICHHPRPMRSPSSPHALPCYGTAPSHPAVLWHCAAHQPSTRRHSVSTRPPSTRLDIAFSLVRCSCWFVNAAIVTLMVYGE